MEYVSYSDSSSLDSDKKNPRSKPSKEKFKRVITNFEARGSVQDGRTANHRPSLSGDNVDKIKNQFEANPNSSIRKLTSVSVHPAFTRLLKRL